MAQILYNKERFINPQGALEELLAEGICNRVFRVTEELVHVSAKTSSECGFEQHAVAGVRNRLVNAYGEIDKENYLECDRRRF